MSILFSTSIRSVLYARVALKSKLKNWRYFGVKMFGTGQDITGLYEQNRVLVVGTKVLFYT